MKTRRYQRGFFQAILPFVPAIAAGISGIFGAKSQGDANDANVQMQRETFDFNANEASKARDFNSAEAARNRDFQQTMFNSAKDYNSYMASTSYQRAVGDMRSAGLNPMLAYSQGGAPSPTMSTPSGSAASGPSASTGNSVRIAPTAMAGLAAAQSAAQLQNLVKQGENIDADTILKDAQATRERASAWATNAQGEKTVIEIGKVRQEIDSIQKDIENKAVQNELYQVDVLLRKTQQVVESGRIDEVEARTALMKVQAALEHLRVPEAQAYSEKFKSEWGKSTSPYIREAVDILRTLIYSRPSR